MIRTITSTGKFTIGPELEKYASGKLDALEKAVPRPLRRYAHVELRFECRMVNDKKENTCELTLRLPREAFVAVETTQHIYAALDIAAAAVTEQLRAYKAARSRSLIKRLTRRSEQA